MQSYLYKNQYTNLCRTNGTNMEKPKDLTGTYMKTAKDKHTNVAKQFNIILSCDNFDQVAKYGTDILLKMGLVSNRRDNSAKLTF